MHVEILSPEERVLYLEQMVTFVEQETTEVRHRIRCTWSAFAKHRQELTSQSYLLRHRLHLFDDVVTPTVTCGAGTWATTKEHRKCSALHSTECFDSSSRQRENTNKHRRKLEKKTFATMKQVRRFRKKAARMMNSTKTGVFHSKMTMKAAQQVKKTI